jgi:hypothetical protein
MRRMNRRPSLHVRDRGEGEVNVSRDLATMMLADFRDLEL